MEVFSSQPSAPALPLVGTMPATDPVQIRDIKGLEPVKAAISTQALGTTAKSNRGEAYQGSSVGARNIVLTMGLNPDWADQTVEGLRQLLYAYFMTPLWCKLRFFSDIRPPVDIEGYVESMDPNIFSEDPEVQVSIICPKPDFIDASSTLIYGEVDDGTAENEFNYIGTVDTGLELRVEQTAENPTYTGSLQVIVNYLTPVMFEIDPVTINGVKHFKLSTLPYAKRAVNVAVADGALTNLLDAVTDISQWPLIQPGLNVIQVIGEESGQKWTLAYFNRFGGL